MQNNEDYKKVVIKGQISIFGNENNNNGQNKEE